MLRTYLIKYRTVVSAQVHALIPNGVASSYLAYPLLFDRELRVRTFHSPFD